MRQIDTIYLFCTLHCNLECIHCVVDASPQNKEYIDLRLAENILSSYRKQKIKNIHITGGEPLLYTKLNEIIDICSSSFKNTKITISTNGTINPAKFRDKFNQKVDEICISIDGWKEHHEKVRGEGSFDKLLNNLNNFISLNCKITILTVSFPWNLNYQESLIKTLLENGIDSVKTIPLKPYGRAKNLGNYGTNIDHPSISNIMALPGKCSDCKLTTNLSIFPDGSTYTCTVQRELDIKAHLL
ncbi:MAG: radical SAM protein [Candidatus Thiodiazotropha sp.]